MKGGREGRKKEGRKEDNATQKSRCTESKDTRFPVMEKADRQRESRPLRIEAALTGAWRQHNELMS
jgi:hypothetical protein